MSRLFLSHSSIDDAQALALADWLRGEGFGDFFLDFDAERGIVPGERWMSALAGAVARCEAVLFLVSPAWQASKYCFAEFYQAKNLGKQLFGVIVRPIDLSALPEPLTAEWQVCDLTLGDDLVEFTAARPPRLPPTRVAFSRPGLEALARGLARAGLAPSTFVWPPAADPQRAPYPGLRALDEADAAVFFGREAAIVRAIDQLRLVRERAVERLFVILGASGSGKSSFLRAGLMPRLRRDTEHLVVLPPLRPERSALSGPQGLLACLLAGFAARGGSSSLGRLRAELEAEGLPGLMLRLAGPDRHTVVLPIDQGEELLAADGGDEAKSCLRLLGSLAQSRAPGLRVLMLMTIRSDALPRLQEHEAIPPLAPVFFSLPAMPVFEFRSVIEGPARRHSEAVRPLEFAPELVDELVHDARGADALPLLALTLEWLYREYTDERGTRVGAGDYHRLGGVRGVIAKAVERALSRPANEPSIPADAAAQKQLLERLFPLIASVDPDSGEWKRRVAPRSAVRALGAQADALVGRLVEQRLLRADARTDGDGAAPTEIVEVTHEALLRQWDLLGQWLRAFSADLANAESLRRAAQEWQRSGRDDALLVHTKGRLEAAEALLADDRLRARFDPVDADYVTACRARDRRELAEREAQLQRIAEQQAARAKLQRRAAAALGIAGLALAGFVAWTVRQTQAVSVQTSLVLAGASEAALERQDPPSAVRLALLATGDSALHPAHAAAWPALQRAVQTHALRRVFPHRAGGSYPAFSPDGRLVVSVADGQLAVIHDVETGMPVGAPIQVGARFVSAVFNRDGTQLLLTTTDADSRIWQTRPYDAKTGRPLAAALRHQQATWGSSYSPDGRHVLLVHDGEHAQVWDTSRWQPVGRRIDHDNEINGVVFSPDGQTFATYSKDYRAGIWRTDTGEAVGAPMVHPEIPLSAQFSPDGRRLLTTESGNTARLWDTATGREIGVPLSSPVRIRSATFSPDGRTIALASDNKTAWLADAETGKSLGRAMYFGDNPQELDWRRDGKRIVARTELGQARVFDTVTGEAAGPPLAGSRHLGAIRFSADGRRLLGRSSEGAYVWDAVAAAPVFGPVKLAGMDTRVRLLGSSRTALLADYGAPLRLLDLESGELRILAASDGTAFSEASPDGRWLLGMSFDLTKPFDERTRALEVSLLDVRTGRVVKLGGLPQTGYADYRFSADGTRLALSSHEGITLWDTEAGRQVGALLVH